MNHDEILYFGYRIIERNPTILYALRVQFPYIFVDEFQDTNPLQTMILSKIREKISKITVIGDIAQSIYSFQGARPAQFKDFSMPKIIKYEINGNRRSTNNIVHLCNYIRRNDNLEQKSIKEYQSQEEKQNAEKRLVHFVTNSSYPKIENIIRQVLKDEGAIITRTWAYAFKYIMDISNEQKETLKKIYNRYYASPIDIRYEISKSSSILWVKAFKFIIYLNKTYKTRTINNILNAIEIYGKVDKNILKENLSIDLIIKINSFLDNIFGNINNQTKVVEIINKFNNNLNESVNEEIKKFLNRTMDLEDVKIELFSEEDNQQLMSLINELEWNTAKSLFNEVFSKDSKYMTVHQAKGLEWKTVFVSIHPTRADATTFSDMFEKSNILSENSMDEFTRMFYVACSRASEELFIDIDEADKKMVEQKLNAYINEKKIDKFYDFI